MCRQRAVAGARPVGRLTSRPVGGMNGSAVEELALQAKTLMVSALGLVALIPGPDRKGNLRVKGLLGSAITYLGIVLLLAPGIALPFLPQPRYFRTVRSLLQALGALLL